MRSGGLFFSGGLRSSFWRVCVGGGGGCPVLRAQQWGMGASWGSLWVK